MAADIQTSTSLVRPRPASLAALLALLIVLPLLPASPAGAQATWQVEVGRFFNENDHSAESMRFFPSALKIHQGDVLRFNTKSFHSVTLLPVGLDAATWTADHAGGVGRRWSVFTSDPDEPDGVKTNLAVMSPSGACGWPTQSPCSFNGIGDEINGIVHSGLALFPGANGAETKQLDFSVKVLVDPGQSFDIVDVLHPGMTMSVEVVAADEAASDLEALDELSADQFAADRTTATKLHNQYKDRKAKKGKGRKTVWSAWAGVETPTVSLRRMYPTKLTIKKNQSVKWNFNKNVLSSHTVSFPAGKARTTAAGFPEIACDEDGDFPEDGVGIADTSPTSASVPFCDDLSQLELDVPAQMTTELGDGALKSATDVESSGVHGAGLAEDSIAYKLKFNKTSGKKGFSYICMIYEVAHADMQGKVVVKP